MKTYRGCWWAAVSRGVLLVLAIGVVCPPARAAAPGPPVLAQVQIRGTVDQLGVPVVAALQDAAGHDYALVIVPAERLRATGLAYRILDRDTSAGYLLALERRHGARAVAATRYRVLLDDGRQIIVRKALGRADELADMGFDLQEITGKPLVFRPPAAQPVAPQIIYDQRVADMIAAVQETAVYDRDGGLSGEFPVSIGGSDYTITTRNTNSGTPIQKATQYVYERMQALGLTVSYHNWNGALRNVIGEKTGRLNPDEIVLVTAHLDDMPSSGRAPGADDNASGSVGVLIAAEVMASQYFEKTLRFVFFTGEEQGLLGSEAYAAMVAANGDNIVAVYNMDMIAWDGTDGPTLRIHTRTVGNPGYSADLAIATTFTDVVSTYGLSGVLTPIIDADGISASDHYSFWVEGYPAVLAIEDDSDDFNPYYHSASDLRQNLNMVYFTDYVKASVGAVAHLAVPGEGPCQLRMAAADLAVDAHVMQGSSSNLNGIFEPGESVMLTPYWLYPEGCTPSLIRGNVSNFTGPGGPAYAIADSSAGYGNPNPLQVVNCYNQSANCYMLTLSNPPTRPAVHMDATVTEALGFGNPPTAGASKDWTLHIGSSFADVPPDRWAYSFIETLLHSGITAGCGVSDFCPATPVSRWQMAVFIGKAMAGGPVPVSGTVPGMGDYNCVAGGTSVFLDVPPGDGGCRFIHYIAAHGITLGCGNNNYCPSLIVSRWQMAVFIAKALAGGTVPVSGTVPGMGDYNCVAGGTSVFLDVPPDDSGCRFIHYIAAEGITTGCGDQNYCPWTDIARDQMAVFLTKGFNLTLYGP